LGITGHLSTFAAVEEFALQNFPQTRAKPDGFKATSCTARLAPNFHHKHVQPPLAWFCMDNFLQTVWGQIWRIFTTSLNFQRFALH
jgi:hypothetical protein